MERQFPEMEEGTLSGGRITACGGWSDVDP